MSRVLTDSQSLTKRRFRRYWESLVSEQSTQDISIITWFIFLGCIPEFGYPYIWICLGNAAFAYTMQQMLQAKRPIDYDPKLRFIVPDPDYMGLPSVKSHMAVVVILPAVFQVRLWLAKAVGAALEELTDRC